MYEIVITSSILILALVILRKIFWGKISRRLQYTLWLLVVIRLLVPASLFTSSLSVMHVVEQVRIPTINNSKNINTLSDANDTQMRNETSEPQHVQSIMPENQSTDEPEYINASQEFSAGVTLKKILLAIYIIGVLCMGCCILLCNLKFHKRLVADRRFLWTEENVNVYLSSCILSPCLWGILSPSIYLTDRSLDSEERKKHILQHEMTHYRHLDYVWTFVRSLCLILYWFHPLVWVAAKLSMEDGELACDEGTLLRLGESQRISYGSTLIEMMTEQKISNRLLYFTTDMVHGKDEIKLRITAIATLKKQIFGIAILVVVLSVFLGVCTAGKSPDVKNNTATTENSEISEDVTDIADEPNKPPGTSISWGEFMEQNSELKDFNIWLADAASPISYGGVSGWFEEYNGERLQMDSGVVFYLANGEFFQDVITKMLSILTKTDSSVLEEEAIVFTKYLEEEAYYSGEVWLIKYLDNYYVMMQWDGIYRLQRQDDIMNYKEKEILFNNTVLYAEDFSDNEQLSGKLSEADNLIFLFRQYEKITDFDPNANYEDMFDLVEKGWGEHGIINYYLNESKYYEAMARNMGLSMSEILDAYEIELTSYNKLYRGGRGDTIYAQAKVKEVKWISDTLVEVTYAFGWFEDHHNTHYFDGKVVLEEYNGEMIFVSNRRIDLENR